MSEEKKFLKLMVDDIIPEKLENIENGVLTELYWYDYTEEFRNKFMETFGDNGNYDYIPLIVYFDQFMRNGIIPVFEWIIEEDD